MQSEQVYHNYDIIVADIINSILQHTDNQTKIIAISDFDFNSNRDMCIYSISQIVKSIYHIDIRFKLSLMQRIKFKRKYGYKPTRAKRRDVCTPLMAIIEDAQKLYCHKIDENFITFSDNDLCSIYYEYYRPIAVPPEGEK